MFERPDLRKRVSAKNLSLKCQLVPITVIDLKRKFSLERLLALERLSALERLGA